MTFDATAPIGAQLITILRDQIVAGDLTPGTRLSEQDIANSFGMSRQPVREAFIKLAAEKLLEIRPQRGTFICKINLAEVGASRFVREAVEADIAKLVAGNVRSDILADLRAQIKDQYRDIAKGGAQFIRLDERFHRSLAAAAGQEAAWAHLQPIKMHMDRVRHLTAQELPLDRVIQQHEAIVDAIEAGDEGRAEQAMRQHLRRVLDDLKTLAAALPDYFEVTPPVNDAQ
jgi:DNA-binding GntR family transcriptional regulator